MPEWRRNRPPTPVTCWPRRCGLLASMGLVAKVDGGVLVLPLLARYRSVTAEIKNPLPVTS